MMVCSRIRENKSDSSDLESYAVKGINATLMPSWYKSKYLLKVVLKKKKLIYLPKADQKKPKNNLMGAFVVS